MPIRTPLRRRFKPSETGELSSKKQVRIPRSRRKAPEWPWPPGVGDAISPEFRRYYYPKEDPPGSGRFYFYLGMTWADTRDFMQGTVQAIAKTGCPYEMALSPSGCVCFRIEAKWFLEPSLQKHVKHVMLPQGPRDVCPAGLPRLSFGKVSLWRMHVQNPMPWLYSPEDWKPIPSQKRVPRKRGR